MLRRLQPVLSSRNPFFSQTLRYSHHFPPPFIFSKCVPNLFLLLTARVSSLKREESAKGIFLSPHCPFKAHLGPSHKEIPSKRATRSSRSHPSIYVKVTGDQHRCPATQTSFLVAVFKQSGALTIVSVSKAS